MLVALLLGLTALLGVAPPATAQTVPSLSSLELVAISKVDPPDPDLYQKINRDGEFILDYSDSSKDNFVNFSPSELLQTDTQSVTITSPRWALHYFCANKAVRSFKPPCRRIRFSSDERITIVSVVLKQTEIDNGGVVWHVVGNSRSYGAKWIPIQTLSPVKLNLDFSELRITYTGEIPSTAKSLRIIPTASSDTIDVSVNSGRNTRVASGDTLVVSSLDAGDNIVTVSVTAGDRTTNYTVTLSRNAVPSFGNEMRDTTFTFTSGYAIAQFQVPAASGGDSTLVYSAIGLPAGLTFDADGSGGCPTRTARQICGTPTARSKSSRVTIYAADSDSNTSASDRASLAFSINIVGVSISGTDPTPLTYANLDSAKITLSLQHTNFVRDVDTSHFELDTHIPNVSISQLSGNPGSGDQAVLILSFSGNFNTDTTLAVKVKVKAAGHDKSHALTTDSITVTPAVPTNVSVTALVDTLEVRWTSVTNADGYKVQWKSGSETYSTSRQDTTTDTTYKIPDLTAGTTYTVQVIATSTEAADSYPSGGVTGVPKFARPGTPTNVQVKPWVAAITVSWDTVATANGYKVRWKSGSQNYLARRERTTTDTTYKIPRLTAGTTYTVQVIATRLHADDSDSVEVTGMPASLDIDGNGEVDLFTDIIMIIRYALSFREESLIYRALDVNAMRTTHQDITAYIESLWIREEESASSSPVPAVSSTDAVLDSVFSSSKAAISMDSAETAYILSALAADGDLTSLLFALGVLLPTPDFDGDGQVTFADFLTFAGKFGTRRGEERYDARCDLNGDGEIGFADFLIFADNFDSAD